MLIVGGSALALKHGFRGTVDIDCDIQPNFNTEVAINITSANLNIPSDFINQDFTRSPSYSNKLWEDAVFVDIISGIKVYVVSDLDQLCMKLLSGRDKDRSDITFLCSLVLPVYSPDIVMKRFSYLYSGITSAKPYAVKLMNACYKRYISG